VEAGVDIDFPLALRALGPLDSIIQTAGRCNREGRREAMGRVVVFEPAEGGMPPGAYETGTGITRTLLAEAGGAIDWHDPDLARRYFRRLYAIRDRDEAEVQRLRERLQFRETEAAYRLIDDDSTPVVVPYDPDPSAQALGAWPLDGLLREIEAKGFAVRDDYRRLQPYLVTLRAWPFEQATARGLCTEVAPGLHRWHGAYDRHLRGLQWEADYRAGDLVV
jgi:CRISPR-associated endonuclease/helicase Cas3